MVDFGSRLKNLRKQKGLVQSQLAEQLGADKTRSIDLTGLTDAEVAALLNLITAMKL